MNRFLLSSNAILSCGHSYHAAPHPLCQYLSWADVASICVAMGGRFLEISHPTTVVPSKQGLAYNINTWIPTRRKYANIRSSPRRTCDSRFTLYFALLETPCVSLAIALSIRTNSCIAATCRKRGITKENCITVSHRCMSQTSRQHAKTKTKKANHE